MARCKDGDSDGYGVRPWLLAASLSGRPGTPTGVLVSRRRRASAGWVKALAKAIIRGHRE